MLVRFSHLDLPGSVLIQRPALSQAGGFRFVTQHQSISTSQLFGRTKRGATKVVRIRQASLWISSGVYLSDTKYKS